MFVVHSFVIRCCDLSVLADDYLSVSLAVRDPSPTI